MARETSHENANRTFDLNNDLIDAEIAGAFKDGDAFHRTVQGSLSIEDELRGQGQYPPPGHGYPRS
ncbi:hypothetical protein [Streptomyces iconiensis]|uniref:Uncharacterized protein n=1 Tax=Streptomyces iconiensis TaxID=1384038 RepID=A0ABT7AB45_9ACTN|nr:hypothetical protein [Streptomyces iconiensis]MDJ1138574.1 hypothetical protein [Streptomyces iconiensis]